MTIVYSILLFFILFLGLPLMLYKPDETKKSQTIFKAMKIGYLVLIFGYMWFLAAFREGIGFDYYSYIGIGENIAALSTLQELFAYDLEPGFVLLTKLIKMISDSTVFMYAVYAALTLIPIAYFIYRHCEDVWFSTWLYITLSFFYCNMNFIRQSLACSIIVLGYGFLRRKQPIPFILVTLLAATFHRTALIMIPIYFLVQITLNKKIVIGYSILVLITFLASEPILNLVTTYIFKSYKESRYVTRGYSLVFLVIPVTALIVCISLFWTWRKRDPDASMLLNMVIISSTIWLFSTKHMIIERFSMYNYVFLLVAIPSALRSLKASPETVAEQQELQEKLDRQTHRPRESDVYKLEELTMKVEDHKKYYISAVVAVLLITFLYNNFGMHINGFHKVFPYQSVLEWFPF